MIKNIDKEKMQEHLRQLGTLGLKANIKHHTVMDKMTTHVSELMKMLKAEIASNKRLKNIISYRDEEIDELNQKNTDQMWELARCEEKITILEKAKAKDDAEVAHYEKKITEYVDSKKVDN